MAETSRAPRTHGSRRSPVGGKFAGLAITLAASFAAAILLLLIFAEDFPAALRLFFLSPFGNKYYFGNMLASTVPLMLAGLGVSLAFASRNFNLGGEGQVYAGGLAAVVVCLMMPDAPPGIVQILAALAGAAVGGGIGSVSGALKRSLGVDELISSFLISASVVLIVDYLITGPFQDQSSNFQTTMAIAPALRFARIMQPSSLSPGIFLGLAICLPAKLALGDVHRELAEARQRAGHSPPERDRQQARQQQADGRADQDRGGDGVRVDHRHHRDEGGGHQRGQHDAGDDHDVQPHATGV